MFEKWWPELEEKVNQILAEVGEPEEPVRSDRELLEEILQLSRVPIRSGLAPSRAIQELLNRYIALHDGEVAQDGNYQDTLDNLRKMHRSVAYITRHPKGKNDQLDKLIGKFNDLSYLASEKDKKDDGLPF